MTDLETLNGAGGGDGGASGGGAGGGAGGPQIVSD